LALIVVPQLATVDVVPDRHQDGLFGNFAERNVTQLDSEGESVKKVRTELEMLVVTNGWIGLDVVGAGG
jgi:hypothetical protein